MRSLLHNELAGNASSASAVSFQSTRDFEEQAALLDGWNQGYTQVSSGEFDGYVSEMRFDGQHLFMEYSSQSLFQSGQLQENVIAVGVPLQFSGNGLFCGAVCNHQSMHIFSGKNGFEFFSPTQLVMAGISVKRDTLLSTVNAEDAELILCHLTQANLLRLDHARVNAVRDFMAGAFAMIRQNPQLLQSAENRASLNQSVISLLAECLVNSADSPAKAMQHMAMSHAKCWHIIADTRELVRESADAPMSVAEVCFQLGISRRTLQYCFQNLLSTTPMAYLRAERLNGVRTMLRKNHSVTAAAAHWGFWHFGHFSQEYKKMFGELPSATFKRHQGR